MRSLTDRRVHERLVRQYRSLAPRYAQEHGEPPPMPVQTDELAAVVRSLRDVVRGERHPAAGAPVDVGGLVDLWLDDEHIVGVLELLDAQSRRAGWRQIRFPLASPEVRALMQAMAGHVL